MYIPKKLLEQKLLQMLAEDVGQGDLTTALLIPEGCMVGAEIIAKEEGIIAGVEETQVLLESLGLKFETFTRDGEKVKPQQVLIKVYGDARTILTAERTILNILSRMSGIATATRKLVEKVQRAGFKVKVACTRKTAPGLLYFDKKAVLVGGGDPHRFHLDDMVLIKDNHIAIAGGIENAMKRTKEKV
jgi:nicotinate-nucleotide pyrophosphorylase [carboxylating] (EC 2.4.2.19)